MTRYPRAPEVELGKMRPLRVVINAQLLPDGHGGGCEQFLMGLVYALGRLQPGPEEYILIGHPRNLDWLKPYLGPNQKIVPKPMNLTERVKNLPEPLLRPARKVWREARRLLSVHGNLAAVQVAESDGFYESLGAEVIHFPFQSFTRCKLPTIFNPHDLQHVHLPQFFSSEQIGWRETVYREACAYARAVCAESQAVKDDLVRFYGIDPDKVYVIYRGAPTSLYDLPSRHLMHAVAQKYALPRHFALYPAQTWPHKNHVRLLEAIHLLRERHATRLNLVCTGYKNDFWPTIRDRIKQLGLGEQVFFIGYAGSGELRALYRLSQFVVFPSLFEGGGFPVVEAFEEGVPVACSSIPALQEYGGDAVLAFDPTSVEGIARALLSISRKTELRATLRMRGGERIGCFSWEQTGKMYRALYRKVAGQTLSEEDQHLLTDRLCSPSLKNAAKVEIGSREQCRRTANVGRA